MMRGSSKALHPATHEFLNLIGASQSTGSQLAFHLGGAQAEQRFRQLTNVGFTAAVRTGPGEVSHIKSFDPTAEETLFFPQLVGG
jgi:hypothetical protein